MADRKKRTMSILLKFMNMGKHTFTVDEIVEEAGKGANDERFDNTDAMPAIQMLERSKIVDYISNGYYRFAADIGALRAALLEEESPEEEEEQESFALDELMGETWSLPPDPIAEAVPEMANYRARMPRRGRRVMGERPDFDELFGERKQEDMFSKLDALLAKREDALARLEKADEDEEDDEDDSPEKSGEAAVPETEETAEVEETEESGSVYSKRFRDPFRYEKSDAGENTDENGKPLEKGNDLNISIVDKRLYRGTPVDESLLEVLAGVKDCVRIYQCGDELYVFPGDRDPDENSEIVFDLINDDGLYLTDRGLAAKHIAEDHTADGIAEEALSAIAHSHGCIYKDGEIRVAVIDADDAAFDIFDLYAAVEHVRKTKAGHWATERDNFRERTVAEIVSDMMSHSVDAVHAEERLQGQMIEAIGKRNYSLVELFISAALKLRLLAAEEAESGKKDENGTNAAKYADVSDVSPLYIQALGMVVKAGDASIEFVQKSTHMSYSVAARMIEWMESSGFISHFAGPSSPRTVLIGKEDYIKLFGPLP